MPFFVLPFGTKSTSHNLSPWIYKIGL